MRRPDDFHPLPSTRVRDQRITFSFIYKSPAAVKSHRLLHRRERDWKTLFGSPREVLLRARVRSYDVIFTLRLNPGSTDQHRHADVSLLIC